MALEPLLAECGLPYIGGQVAQRGAATPGGLALRDPKLFPRRGLDLGEDLSMIGLERAPEALARSIGEGLLRDEIFLVAGMPQLAAALA